MSMRYDGTVHRYAYYSTQTHILRLQANQFAFTSITKTKRLVLFVNFLSARRLLVGMLLYSLTRWPSTHI